MWSVEPHPTGEAEIEDRINRLLYLKSQQGNEYTPKKEQIDYAKELFPTFRQQIEEMFEEERKKPNPEAHIFISPFQIHGLGKSNTSNHHPRPENLISDYQKALTAFHDLLQMNGYNVLNIYYSTPDTMMITNLHFKIAMPNSH